MKHTHLISLTIATSAFQLVNAQEKTNIIFILTDDHRYDLLGINGHQLLKTPNIDQLAREGMQFSRAYVTSAMEQSFDYWYGGHGHLSFCLTISFNLPYGAGTGKATFIH